MSAIKITTLFLDIGGVVLTNGWDEEARDRAISRFKLDKNELNERHHLTFDTYEEGKLTLTEYLRRIVFYKKRTFSEKDFIDFMFQQSTAYEDSIDFFKKIKQHYQLKVVAVSNEGRELNEFRIKKFKLDELFDVFISSSFVHLRKPDIDIFRMAIDISHATPERSIYIDDRMMFVELATTLGINGIHYTGLTEIKSKMEAIGFSIK